LQLTPALLPDGQTIPVQTLLRRERRHPLPVTKTASCWAPNKVAIDFDGEPTWEEYAIVRELERCGWWACWVKFWYGSREFCTRPGESVAMPAEAAEVFQGIERSTRGAGAWDVYAWNDGPLFVESKQYRSSDRLNHNQIAWLSTAIAQGIDPSRFAIVNYDAGRPAAMHPRPTANPLDRSTRRASPTVPTQSQRRSRRHGVLDQVTGSKPPRATGACTGITGHGLPCPNPGRYLIDGKLSCSRRHAQYR
jgi:hypothetical protein